MARYNNLFKKALGFPIIWVGVIYLFWLMLVPIDESFTTGIKLLGIYFVITVLEMLLGANKTLIIILFIVLLPLAGVASLLALDLWISTAGWLGREFIYIPLIILFSSYNIYNLFQKPSSENKTFRTLLLVAMLPILGINIAYPVAHFPEVSDRTEFGNFKYYIVWGIDGGYRSHLTFYKCKKWSTQCDHLYRSYDKMFSIK